MCAYRNIKVLHYVIKATMVACIKCLTFHTSFYQLIKCIIWVFKQPFFFLEFVESTSSASIGIVHKYAIWAAKRWMTQSQLPSTIEK